MKLSQPKSRFFTDNVDVWKTFDAVCRGRWLILTCTSLFFFFGLGYAFLSTDWYRAQLVFIEAPAMEAGTDLEALLLVGQLGGGCSRVSGRAAINTLKSKEFLRSFVEELNLLPVLLGPGVLLNNNVNVYDAVDTFQDILSVDYNVASGVGVLSVRWKDPYTAATWANLLVAALNTRLRSQAQIACSGASGYLQEQIAETSVASVRQYSSRLLEATWLANKFLQSSDNFVFQVIDSAVPPIKPIANRELIVAIFSSLGLIVGMLLLAIWSVIKASILGTKAIIDPSEF